VPGTVIAITRVTHPVAIGPTEADRATPGTIWDFLWELSYHALYFNASLLEIAKKDATAAPLSSFPAQRRTLDFLQAWALAASQLAGARLVRPC